MKLGFISSILESSSFEEVIDTASELGYECVEAACWPKEKAARRYAGITHIRTIFLVFFPKYDTLINLQKKSFKIRREKEDFI